MDTPEIEEEKEEEKLVILSYKDLLPLHAYIDKIKILFPPLIDFDNEENNTPNTKECCEVKVK